MSRLPAHFAAACAVSIIASACASGGAKSSARLADCQLRPQDSSYVSLRPVYRDCGVDVRAKAIPTRVTPNFTPRAVANSACYIVEMQFVVDTLGSPEMPTYKVLRTNEQSYAEAVREIVPMMRFEPAKKDGVLVRQIVETKQGMATRTVVVPAGTRPSGGSANSRPPRC